MFILEENLPIGRNKGDFPAGFSKRVNALRINRFHRERI